MKIVQVSWILFQKKKKENKDNFWHKIAFLQTSTFIKFGTVSKINIQYNCCYCTYDIKASYSSVLNQSFAQSDKKQAHVNSSAIANQLF